ncbi:concanavalin A-like lectin/glucanase domain-containing protein [Dipodascopsis uninucleata]
MKSVLFLASVLSSLHTLVVAQTTAGCNPLYGTCAADPGLGTSIDIDFTAGSSSRFNIFNGADQVSYDSTNGLDMTISQLGQSPTLASNFYIFYGKVEVETQAAPGQGIVSSIVLLSDTNDEIDFEWIGGDTGHVQTNWFSKGDTLSTGRGGISSVSNPQSTFHTYTIDWTSTSLTWSIDGSAVRTVSSTAPQGYPQTPMQLKVGSWVGGDPSNAVGTIGWAGGLANFEGAPYHFYIRSIKVTDYSTGSEYLYTDNSGSSSSVEVIGGGSYNYYEDGDSSTTTSSSSSSTSSTSSSPTSFTISSATSFAGSATTRQISSSTFSSIIYNSTSLANSTSNYTANYKGTGNTTVIYDAIKSGASRLAATGISSLLGVFVVLFIF